MVSLENYMKTVYDPSLFLVRQALQQLDELNRTRKSGQDSGLTRSSSAEKVVGDAAQTVIELDAQTLAPRSQSPRSERGSQRGGSGMHRQRRHTMDSRRSADDSALGSLVG